MSIKTVRFNKQEESLLKLVLGHYNKDFSSCVKELIAEKIEDLQDIRFIKKIRESKKSDYLTAEQIQNKIKN